MATKKSDDTGTVWVQVRMAQGRINAQPIQRLIGFWVLWHTFGGMEDLAQRKIVSQSGVYNSRKEFRLVFGVDVQDWQPELAAQIAAQRALVHEAAEHVAGA
jgi:hypothetical protein